MTLRWKKLASECCVLGLLLTGLAEAGNRPPQALPTDGGSGTGTSMIARGRFEGQHWSWKCEVVVLDGQTGRPMSGMRRERSNGFGRGLCRCLSLKLTNPTDHPVHLTLGLRVTVLAPSPVRFWDGLRQWECADVRLANHNLRGTFPMSCLLFDGFGVAAGLAPMEIVSWFEHSYERTEEGWRLACETRMALDPGESVEKEFVFYGFAAPFGYRDALQVYYDAFPEVFRPLPDVDPRVSLNGATYWAWSRNEPERCRRMFAGWEWCYAPFRRTGDWYGRADRWDYEPARPIRGARDADRETYLAARKKQFERGDRCDVAMLFYLPSCIWVETQLVKQGYAEAVIYRNGKPYELTTPWVTGHDNETMVFPWANKLAEDSMKDMRRIVEDLAVAGFAFDTADGGWPYRGPAIRKSPGRAWDEDGEFCDVSVATAQLMDFAHTLRKDGRRMAMVSNPGASMTFMTPFRSDAAMMEKPPYRSVETHLLPLRHLLGHKTMVWWDDWSAARVLRWEAMTGDEIREALLGMRDYVLLASLHYGGIPTPRLAVGTPKLMRALPMIVELVGAGWQPTPGAMTDPPSDLWISRFGLSENTFLAVCNQTAEEFAGVLVVRHDYVKPADRRFLTYEGGPVEQQREHNTTRIPIRLRSRDYLVFRLTPPAQQPDRARLDFPFKEALIVLPDQPGDSDKYAAFRLQEYFRFYYANAVEPPQDVRLRIVTQSEAENAASQPQLIIGANAPEVQGNRLLVPSDRKQLMTFLRFLDRKYFYAGRFPSSGEGEGEAELLKKAGVAGEVLE